MGFQQNTIPHEEYMKRMDALMPRLIKHRTGSNNQDIIELFFLYNDRLLPRESKRGCGGCRERVFKQMVSYYETLKQTA